MFILQYVQKILSPINPHVQDNTFQMTTTTTYFLEEYFDLNW